MLKSEVKFLSLFGKNPLLEKVSGNTLSVVGVSEPSFANDSSGYHMNRNQFLLLRDFSSDITDQFSLGFDLIPLHEGRIKNGSSTNPVKVSVLDFGTGNGELSDFNMTKNTLIIHEECQEDGINNKMKFLLHDNIGNLAYTSLTPNYEVNKKHNFWFTYNGSTSDVTVFVDGIEASLSVSGTIPSTIDIASSSLSINRYALNDSDLINSNGKIDNIVLLNSFIDSKVDIQKSVNNSISYLIDDDFTNIIESDFGIFFNDPVPVRTNDSEKFGNNILAARSDGTLMEGSRLLWQVRRNFSDPNELQELKFIEEEAEQKNQLLKLNSLVEL